MVNSKTYRGTKYFTNKEDIPSAKVFAVFYWGKDPSIHSDNPKEELEELSLKLKETSTPIYGWLLFCASALGFIYWRWSFINERKRRQEFSDLIHQNKSRSVIID
jgi:hypothetical protein